MSRKITVDRPLVLLLALCVVGPATVRGQSSVPEKAAADVWFTGHLIDSKFATAQPSLGVPARTTEPGLDVYANNDPVIPGARGDAPLKIGDSTYAHGLYCHAVSQVVVTLPGPGKRFSAVVGLDHNDDTARGRGSVVFSVTVGSKTAFRSEVLRYGTPAVKVDVDLDGARSFTLEISDAGDGISWDQADWADAMATLSDGQQLWLEALPIRDHRAGAALTALPRASQLPFSFVYGDQHSDTLLASWAKTESSTEDPTGKHHTLTWQDPATGLQVRCEAVEYSEFAAVEWTVYFKNNGSKPTPILRNLLALDTELQRSDQGEFQLHAWKGDTCAPDLYEPWIEPLEPNAARHFAPADGRGTNHAFPYYHLRMPGGGILWAVGWPGQWSTSFLRDAGTGLRLLAGQQQTHLSLHPGEEIRTPLIAMVFCLGDDVARAQNIWRRWMWAHNVPRTADGAVPPPILFGNTSGIFNEMINANEENQKYFIDRYLAERIPIDYWWMDAGWYPCDGHWPNTGTWESDPTRFPHGLRAISDHALARGVKTLVWFEPERVGGGWLSQNHPEWRLGPLLNLGNREAWHWLVNHVDGQLTSQGIHLYRQDFNMSPLSFWRGNDAPERQGMTENLHIQGYLAYWDELKRRHPQLIIDSCASGGRRNDLETMRRAVPLHPTDYNYGDLAAKQAFHHSLYHWIPYFGSNTVPMDRPDPYAIRSGQSLSTTYGYDMRRTDFDYEQLRILSGQLKRMVPFYYEDYYPLTPYSRDHQDWIAWQFHRPEQDEGMVQAFRRDQCEASTMTFPLSALDEQAEYRVHDLDQEEVSVVSGKELSEVGLRVTIANRPGAVVIHYEEVK